MAAPSDSEDMVATEGAFSRIFAQQIDALPLVLQCLGSQRAICSVARVSRAWMEASACALPIVKVLDLRYAAAALTDEALLHLLGRPPTGSWPLLESVNLAGCSLLTDAGLQALTRRRMAKLSDVNLCCLPRVTADGVSAMCDALAATPNGPSCQLKSLELSGCTRIRETELIARFARFLDLADEEEDGLGACQG